MTKKLLKIILISLLISSFCVTFVSASDINLNLPGTDNNTQVDNNVANNQNANNQDVNAPNNENDVIGNNNVVSPTDTQTLQPSTVSSNSDSGLSITNIINILLITVGVILILLAIAIIIRLK